MIYISRAKLNKNSESWKPVMIGFDLKNSKQSTGYAIFLRLCVCAAMSEFNTALNIRTRRTIRRRP